MAKFNNGEIPYDQLVKIGSGPDSITGSWEWWLPPATLARWNAMVAAGLEKYGVRLRITQGWNCFRPLAIQVKYKAHFTSIGKPGQAAAAGHSSHGGEFNGADCMAIDVANWQDLAPGNEALAWSRFQALCRLYGFTTDFVQPTERWHIGDFQPWVMPAGLDPHPFISEEDDMLLALRITDPTNKKTYLATLGRGVFRHLIGSDDPERVKNIVRGDDKWTDITIQELPVYLWTYGCDLNIWDVRGGDFAVLNPLDGSVKAGGMWSAENAIRAQLATIAKKPAA